MAALDTDLTTAATVATELGVSAGDARLPRLISAASDACRAYMLRGPLHYVSGLVENVKAPWNVVRIALERTPVVSVASVVLPDGTSLVQNTDYTLEDAAAGLLYRSNAAWPWTGFGAGRIEAFDPMFNTATGLIVVTYTGGWVTPGQISNASAPAPQTLPYQIEQACIEIVGTWYLRGGANAAIQAETLGDASITYVPGGQGAVALPVSACALLDAYRRWP